MKYSISNVLLPLNAFLRSILPKLRDISLKEHSTKHSHKLILIQSNTFSITPYFRCTPTSSSSSSGT